MRIGWPLLKYGFRDKGWYTLNQMAEGDVLDRRFEIFYEDRSYQFEYQGAVDTHFHVHNSESLKHW